MAKLSDFQQPPIAKLGRDLLRLTRKQLFINLGLPFAFCGAYFVFAAFGWWPPAVWMLRSFFL